MNIKLLFVWTFRSLYRNFRRSFLIVLLISICVACLTFFFALKVGVHKKMIENTTNFYIADFQINSHISSLRIDKTIADYSKKNDQIMKSLKSANSTFRKISIGFIEKEKINFPIYIAGINTETEKKVSKLLDTINQNNFNGLIEHNKIIIGAPIAKELQVEIGDTITLIIKKDKTLIVKKCAIQSIYSAALNNFDKRYILANFEWLNSVLGENTSTEFAIKIKNDYNKKDIMEKLKNIFDKDCYITDWRELLPDVLKLIELNNIAMFVVLIIFYIVIFISAANILLISLYEKLKIFGIFIAFGISYIKVAAYIFIEAFLIGVISIILGFSAAYPIVKYSYYKGIDFSKFFEYNPYFMLDMIIRPELPINEIAQSYFLLLVILLLAAAIPIKKLMTVNTIELLREP
ncbi:MAG TPA: ABC transporter permease [bacterium]|nr:ABC transporter permease [bacterium]